MRIVDTLTGLLAIAMVPAIAQTPSGAAGTGPYAVPSAAAYAIIPNAAHKIVTDNGLVGKTVVIYDAQLFSLVATYQTAVEHLKATMTTMCAPVAHAADRALAPIDIGTAASGLAALVTALTPSYAIQGQALPFDNSALVAAFAKEAGVKTVLPAYLVPAGKQHDVACGGQAGSTSLVDLWYGAAVQADKLRNDIESISGTTDADKAKKQALQRKVDTYVKIAESYLAVEKSTSLLAKLLVVESLTRLASGSTLSVIDLKLDAVGMESITRTWVGTKKTNFACSVLAHYTLLELTTNSSAISLKPVTTDMVNILLKIPNEDKFGTSVTPRGVINGPNSQQE